MSTDEINAKKINKLKQSLKKKKYEVLPQMFAVLFLIGGLLLNLFANIIHDQAKSFGQPFYTVYVFVVPILYISFILFIWYWLKKFYTDPIDKINKEIEDLKNDS